MDQLVETLASEWTVTTTPCSTLPPRFDLYKKKPCLQEHRRKEYLDRQKDRRYDAVQLARNLAEGFVSAKNKPKEDAQEDMDDSEVLEKPSNSYANQLMLSEWLIEVPLDLREYLIVFCPKGRRGLLVASQGITKLYSRSGYCFHTFASNLPGGSRVSKRQPNWKPNEFTILDVVYNEQTHTCYILDLIAWRSGHYYDSESEFRFYWLRTQFDQCSEEINQTKRKVQLELVKHSEWDPQHVEDVLLADEDRLASLTGFQAPLDGLLFYHRQGHYLPGKCPLVGWLRPGMVDRLGLKCHPRHLETREGKEKAMEDS